MWYYTNTDGVLHHQIMDDLYLIAISLWLYSVLSEYGTVNAFGQRQSRGLSSAAITPLFKMSQSAPIPILTPLPQSCLCLLYNLTSSKSVLFIKAAFWITIAMHCRPLRSRKPAQSSTSLCYIPLFSVGQLTSTISSLVTFASCHHTTLPKTQRSPEGSDFVESTAGN